MCGCNNSLCNVKEMVLGVWVMGMEVCVMLGMIDVEQVKEFCEVGFIVYNYNFDMSCEFYFSIILICIYDECFVILGYVCDVGINVCLGGILGLGEIDKDRIGLLYIVVMLLSYLESFLVNVLVFIKGILLGDRKLIDFISMLCIIVVVRIIMLVIIICIVVGCKIMMEE